MDSNELRDLHTHFQGMGTGKFWTSMITEHGDSLEKESFENNKNFPFNVNSGHDLFIQVSKNRRCTPALVKFLTGSSSTFKKDDVKAWSEAVKRSMDHVTEFRFTEVFQNNLTKEIIFSIEQLQKASDNPI